MVGEKAIQDINDRSSSDGTTYNSPVHLLQIEQTRHAISHGHVAHARHGHVHLAGM